MPKAIFKCELCSSEVNERVRLCAVCVEMVQRIAYANAEMARHRQHEEPAESLKKKSQRGQAKAEGLTPVILG